MLFYFSIIFIVLIGQLLKKSKIGTNIFTNSILSLILVLISTILLLNPLTIDMERYLRNFTQIRTMGLFDALSNVRWEPGFVIYQWGLSKFTTSGATFMFISLTIIWLLIIYALKKIVSYRNIPLVMIGYMSLFTFYALIRTVLRQGFAMPLLVLMLINLENDNYKKALICFGLSISFHLSSVIGIIMIPIKKFNISIKTLFNIYIICSIMMIFDINRNIMLSLSSFIGGRIGDSILRYASGSTILRYGSVNRIDFLIFTTFWLMLSLFFRYKYLKNDMNYEWLIKSYMGFSIVYILFGFIGYSDRIASYAWFLIPILAFYPVVKMKSKNRLGWMIVCVATNIIMFFVFDIASLYKIINIL